MTIEKHKLRELVSVPITVLNQSEPDKLTKWCYRDKSVSKMCNIKESHDFRDLNQKYSREATGNKFVFRGFAPIKINIYFLYNSD